MYIYIIYIYTYKYIYIYARTCTYKQDFTISRKHVFRYVPEPKPLSVLPAYLRKDAGVPITLTHSNMAASFTATYSLSCHFTVSTSLSPSFDTLNVNASTYASLVSPNSIVCASPQLVAGSTVYVQISPNRQRVGKEEAVRLSVYETPVTASVTPTWGKALGGTKITIYADTFDTPSPRAAPVARFGARTVVGTAVTGDADGGMPSAVFVTPPGPHPYFSMVPLHLSVDGGTSFSAHSQNFTYYALPALMALRPSLGVALTATTVTIVGRNMRNTASLVCRFGTVVVQGTYISASASVECTSPATLGALNTISVVNVSVSLNGIDTEFAPPLPYTYYPVMTPSALEPSAGPKSGGTAITITASGLIPSEFMRCKFVYTRSSPSNTVNPVIVTAVIQTAGNTAACTTPALLEGEWRVWLSLDTVNYQTSSTQMLFLSVPMPNVSALSPNMGPSESGSMLEISGAGFVQVCAHVCVCIYIYINVCM